MFQKVSASLNLSFTNQRIYEYCITNSGYKYSSVANEECRRDDGKGFENPQTGIWGIIRVA